MGRKTWSPPYHRLSLGVRKPHRFLLPVVPTSPSGTSMADGVQFVDGLVSQACLNAARPTSGSWEFLGRGSWKSAS
ncbi:hypothetical protein FA13DRAFT_283752 [Coprinellus micaceus]|uniref:Uncharacterized protein n=1 Tax=Coprinellus micaceus TaxID=71717 RepID=A0A4Y7TDR2_COPMI|nr:hypothetical protein FA13DRAFT_283752 [Coprinellus micaceus]